MAYRFKKNEAIPNAIRRVFAEEIAWAVGHLAHSKKRTQAVHEARKSIKKIRGLLSLIETPLGPRYKTQDRYFREDLSQDFVAARVGGRSEQHVGVWQPGSQNCRLRLSDIR